jgi:hypothetical protein
VLPKEGEISMRVNCYVPDSTGLMLEEMKNVTEIDKKDLIVVAIRQLYKTMVYKCTESDIKNMA